MVPKEELLENLKEGTGGAVSGSAASGRGRCLLEMWVKGKKKGTSED